MSNVEMKDGWSLYSIADSDSDYALYAIQADEDEVKDALREYITNEELHDGTDINSFIEEHFVGRCEWIQSIVINTDNLVYE